MPATNPWFMAFSNLDGMLDVAKPGAIIITGRGNRYDAQFQEARKRGAHVYVYWNVLNCPDNLKNPQDQEQYLINGQRPPLWPYPTPGTRTNWPGTHLLDIRPGTAYMKDCIAKTGALIDKHMFDGLFLDTLGARPWAAEYQDWPATEQQLWTECCVNMAREVYEECRKHGYMMELIHNNLWVMAKSFSWWETALHGEKYCNGICLENCPPGPQGQQPSDFHRALAGRPYGILPRRVVSVHKTDAASLAWAKTEGVTHACSVEPAKGETYAKVTPAIIPYSGWPPEETTAENAALRARVAELTAENEELQKQLDAERQKLATAQAKIVDLGKRMAQINSLSAVQGTGTHQHHHHYDYEYGYDHYEPDALEIA